MSEQYGRPLIMLDDDIEIRPLTRSLASLDGEVIEAKMVKSLELIIERHRDLVILDVMMPTLSGWGVQIHPWER